MSDGLIRMLTVVCPGCGRAQVATFDAIRRDPRCGFCGHRVTRRDITNDTARRAA